MSPKTLAVAAVVVAAAAVVAVKTTLHRPAEAAVAERGKIPSIVLVADPREADTDCGCGEIIRRVRQARARGVEVLELPPAGPGVARYGVTVTPTVLVLGDDGSVVARREGESRETVAAIEADLAALEGAKR
jgi:hypothetical protein